MQCTIITCMPAVCGQHKTTIISTFYSTSRSLTRAASTLGASSACCALGAAASYAAHRWRDRNARNHRTAVALSPARLQCKRVIFAWVARETFLSVPPQHTTENIKITDRLLKI